MVLNYFTSGNLVMIIINVATAMAPLASAVLDVALAITDFIKLN